MHAPSQKDMLRARGYIPASEAAARMGVSVYHVYDLLNAGKLTEVTAGEGRYARRYVSSQSIIDHLGPEMSKLLGLVK